MEKYILEKAVPAPAKASTKGWVPLMLLRIKHWHQATGLDG